MAEDTTRFKDNDQKDPENGDAVPFQALDDNKDYWMTVTQLANKAREIIGDATALVSGMFSAGDKKKLDSFPDTIATFRTLETDSAGQKVWSPKVAPGDMLKSDYDSQGDNVVNEARAANKIGPSTAGNDKVYITTIAGVQIFIDRTAFIAGEATKIEENPGNDYVFITDASGVQGWIKQQAFIDAVAAALGNPLQALWQGVTTDNTPTELFLNGGSSRFPVPVGETYEFIIRTLHKQDDDTDFRAETKRGIIQNNAGTVALLGAIQVSTDMPIDTTANAVTTAITADDANDSLKVEVTSIDSENWNHAAFATFTKLTT